MMQEGHMLWQALWLEGPICDAQGDQTVDLARQLAAQSPGQTQGTQFIGIQLVGAANASDVDQVAHAHRHRLVRRQVVVDHRQPANAQLADVHGRRFGLHLGGLTLDVNSDGGLELHGRPSGERCGRSATC